MFLLVCTVCVIIIIGDGKGRIVTYQRFIVIDISMKRIYTMSLFKECILFYTKMFIMFWLIANLIGMIRIGLGLAFYRLGSLENFGLNASNVLGSDCVACTEFGMSMLVRVTVLHNEQD